MGERRPLGCGRFSDEQWAELIVSNTDAASGVAGQLLLAHAQTCAACREELAAYTQLSAQVRLVAGEVASNAAHPASSAAPEPSDEAFREEAFRDAVRTAFVDSIMADVRRQRREKQVRDMRLRRSVPAWAAAAVVLFVAILTSRMPLPTPLVPESESSVGQAWPGGTILTLSDEGGANSGGLTTVGVTAATTEDGPRMLMEVAGTDASVLAEQQTGAPIRVPAGSASAAVDSPFESEGGFPAL